MNEFLGYVPAALFYVLGAIAIASSILVVASRNPIHSALFLLVTFLCVAVLFFMQGAEFVGAVQILVYAGGVMVLFLFVVMLINMGTLGSERVFSPYVVGGLVIGFVVLAFLGWISQTGAMHPVVDAPDALRTAAVSVGSAETTVAGNSEAVGMLLYQKYLVPFEVASLFLLVAMIGAIIIGKRELHAFEEESNPQFVRDRVAAEKKMKESLRA
jgi:NADH-quinone oxidoreductase subunit J